MEGNWKCDKCGATHRGFEVEPPAHDEVRELTMTCQCGATDTFKVYWSQPNPQLLASRVGPGNGLPRFCPGVDRALRGAADALGRTRFLLELNDDDTWSFSAPSTLSYSPRPGDMAGGATATEAMREWIKASRPDTQEGVGDGMVR